MRFPLTPNGKVDRNALPAPDRRAPLDRPGRAFTMYRPATRSKKRLPPHSATSSASRPRSALATTSSTSAWPFADGCSTAGPVAGCLRRRDPRSRICSRRRTSLPWPTGSKMPSGPEQRTAVDPARSKRPTAPSALPASFAQQRLWFLDQLEPNQATYNLTDRRPACEGVNLIGDILAQAFNDLARRHESLADDLPRVSTAEPIQVIAPATSRSDLPIDRPDPPPRTPTAKPEALLRLKAEEARRPFDLATRPARSGSTCFA